MSTPAAQPADFPLAPVPLSRSPYIDQGPDLWAVIEIEADGDQHRPLRVIGTFDTEDRAEVWADEHLGSPTAYAVVPFDMAHTPADDQVDAADPPSESPPVGARRPV